jgi:hypothetical protein
MRNLPHTQTLIATIRNAINGLRKSRGWSRETAVQEIVEAHERIGADKLTGLSFELPGRDAVARMKVNAERVYRWLDDEGKDNNLLPANMLPSVLESLPADVRLGVVNDILRPLGMEAHGIERDENASFDASTCASATMKESAEAAVAILAVGSSPTMATLQQALKEVMEAEEAIVNAKRALMARIEQGQAPAPLRSVG